MIGAPTATPGMTISKEESARILLKDIAQFEARVERLVKVPLTYNQFAVLSPFDFNAGELHPPTLLKKLNKGDYGALPGELARWVKATDPRRGKKVTVQGLVNRRAAEAGL